MCAIGIVISIYQKRDAYMLIDGRPVEEIIMTMLEVVKSTHDGYQQLIVVGACILILLIISKKDRTRLCFPVVLIAILLFIPQLYVYVYEATSYKRFFWLLPDGILVAYVSILLISKIKYPWAKAVTAGIISLLLVITGQSIYSDDVGFYHTTDNLQQVDASTKELVDNIIALDAEPTCIFPSITSVMTRVYNANIIQAYGRNTYGYNGPIDPILEKVYNNLNSDSPDTDFVFSVAKSKGIKFVVTYSFSIIDEQICAEYGYSLCRNVANYNIYYNPNPIDETDEWYITQYGPNWGRNCFYTIEDSQGNLVIIDGGHFGNSRILEGVLRDHDYHVSAWIITTLYDDHIGAVFDILQEYGDLITVDNIYIQLYSDEMLDTIYSHQQLWEQSKLDIAGEFINLINQMDNVIYVKAGQDYDLIGLKMHVYHIWDDSVNGIGSGETSNSSMVFSISGSEQSVLFLSATTKQVESAVTDSIGDKQFDYVVANDHGNWSYNYEWYADKDPTGVFIDEYTAALDPEGQAFDFYSYCLEKGYNVFTFATVPNRISIR